MNYLQNLLTVTFFYTDILIHIVNDNICHKVIKSVNAINNVTNTIKQTVASPVFSWSNGVNVFLLCVISINNQWFLPEIGYLIF